MAQRVMTRGKECCLLSCSGMAAATVITISSIGTLAMSIIVAVNAQVLPFSKGIRIFLKTLAIIMSVTSSLVILLCLLLNGCLCACCSLEEKDLV